MARVCAVVVTCNRKDLLRTCLNSLRAQTRPVDRILVVNNASTDGTGALLDTEFGTLARLEILARLDLKESVGGAGAINAGLKWTHCNKYEWAWVMHDGVEVAPDCLKRMLAFEGDGDMIQVRVTGESAPDTARPWVPVQHCDFAAALIRDRMLEEAGFPDLRYYNAGDDTAYGYLVAKHGSSICLNYAGVVRNVPEVPALGRTTFYLGIRNLFLNRANLAEGGAMTPAPKFFWQTLVAVVRQLGRAVESGGSASAYAMATVDGLRDGLHKRFDRLPQE